MLLREHERSSSADRSEILTVLHHNAQLTRHGKGLNLALVGQQRIGKIMLAQRFADDLRERHSPLVPVYFGVARNLFVPSVFAIRLLASIGRSFIEADGRRVEQSGGVLNAASSNIHAMERIMQSATSPLSDQFQVVPVPPFDRAATAELCHKSLPKHLLTQEAVARLFEFTSGHPFYPNCPTTAMRRLDADRVHLWNRPNDDVLDRAIYEEILTQEGRICQYCEHRVEMALTETRGKTTLRSVLLVLAGEGKANLSQIGAQLKRAPGEVHSYLKHLADIDLVGREGRRYYITDPIVALWVSFTMLERTPEYGGYKDAIRRYQDWLAEQTA